MSMGAEPGAGPKSDSEVATGAPVVGRNVNRGGNRKACAWLGEAELQPPDDTAGRCCFVGVFTAELDGIWVESRVSVAVLPDRFLGDGIDGGGGVIDSLD